MSAKNYLKAAKDALTDENPDYCIQLAQDALKIDPNLYFAHVFIGKSYHLLKNFDGAIHAYRAAVAIDKQNMMAWKGLLLIVKNKDDPVMFFSTVTDYIEVLLEIAAPLIDIIGEIKLYLKKFPESLVFEEYWKNLIPESRLGQLTRGIIEPFDKAISKYLDIILKREESEVSKTLSSQRLKSKSGASLNGLAWNIYNKSNVSSLYEELINLTDDTDERRITEERYLKYKVKVLKVTPDKSQQKSFKKIKQMVQGMIVVKHTSFYVWSLYFDYLDFEELNLVPKDIFTTFLKLFGSLPLGQIIFAYVRSDLCQFNIDLNEDNKKSKKSKKEEIELSSEEQNLLELENADDDENLASQEELLSIMEDSLESCKTSLFAYRILLSYRVYLKQYSTEIQICQDAIQLLTRASRDTGCFFPHTKEDFLVNFATILTYHEAPKNYRRALELYDSVLVESPKNIKAIVGKGLILSEGGNFEESKILLEKVVYQSPDHIEAVNELAWIYIRLGDCTKGREKLLEILPKIKGTNVFAVELKATVNWRIAQSYLGENQVAKSYEYLVDSLRSSKEFAPSYTSLGKIYLNNYKDSKRARKCFLKAFELDPSEISAAWYLVKEFAESSEWGLAESFSKRLISSENSKRKLGNNSWPYRVLGMAALESQDEAKAIEWFQNAIRIDADDTESWIGLGESYFGCGRLEAAVKVFKRALELNSDHWIAKYLLGVVLYNLSQFDESIRVLEALLIERPDEECVIYSLSEAYLKYSSDSVLQGFFGKAIGLTVKVTNLIPKGNTQSYNFWKLINDLILIFLQIQSKINDFPYEILLETFKQSNTFEVDEDLINSYLEREKIVQIAALFLTYANKAALGLNPISRPLRSSSLYNLGLSQVIAFLKTKDIKYREESISSLKEAIKLQNNYPEAWIALGVATTSANARVSQHCFIKASSLDSKNIDIWSNLALLFLRYGDYSLASEAYSRGQSLAPSQPISWLGNALTTEALGDEEMAHRLFTHAFILGNGKSPSAQLAYGISICMKKIGKNDDVRNIESVQEFSSAAYGMVQYLKHYPLDSFGLSITCLILERLNDYELGDEIAKQLLSVLEKSYEETETEQDLEQYARIKTQLSRFNLGLNDYESAIENSTEVLSLSSDPKTVISSRTVLGLSYFFLDKFDEALEEFKEILSLSGDSRRLVVLIAQVLYYYDTEETKQAALDQLFNTIETSGTSLLVTLVIGAISVVENLEDYWEIIKSELEGLTLNDLIEDKFRNVPFLISEINKKLTIKQTNESLQRSAFYFPDDLRIWNTLDKNIALKIAAQGKVSATELSESYLNRKDLNHVQRSIFIAPWNREIYPL